MFYHGRFIDRDRILPNVAALNSTLTYLFLELYGRHNIEGRFNIYGPELRPLPIPNIKFFSNSEALTLEKQFKILAKRTILKITDEIHQIDRRALDDIIFNALGLTPGEREAVYEAVINLVEARLKKAASV